MLSLDQTLIIKDDGDVERVVYHANEEGLTDLKIETDQRNYQSLRDLISYKDDGRFYYRDYIIGSSTWNDTHVYINYFRLPIDGMKRKVILHLTTPIIADLILEVIRHKIIIKDILLK